MVVVVSGDLSRGFVGLVLIVMLGMFFSSQFLSPNMQTYTLHPSPDTHPLFVFSELLLNL